MDSSNGRGLSLRAIGRGRSRGRALISPPKRTLGRGGVVEPARHPPTASFSNMLIGRGTRLVNTVSPSGDQSPDTSPTPLSRGRGMNPLPVPVVSLTMAAPVDDDDDDDSDQFDDCSDSDDDLMAIGRQFRPDSDSAAASGRFSAFAAAGALPPKPSVDPKLVWERHSKALSEWRKDLRTSSVHCLGPDLLAERLLDPVQRRWQAARGRTEEMAAWVRTFVANARRPYQAALVLVNSLVTNKKSKTGEKRDPLLAQALVDGLKAADIAAAPVDPSERRYAFFLVQREGMGLARDLVRVFGLRQGADEDLGPLVDTLVEKGVYLEAGQLVGLLRLHARYPVEKLMLPLIAENRTIVVEECVSGEEEAQRRLLLFLDDFHDKPDQIASLLSSSCNLDTLQLKEECLSSSALKKLALRLHKKFGLAKSALPTLSLAKGCSDIAHLAHERYVRGLLRDDWEAAVLEAVGDLPSLAEALVRTLVEYRAGLAARSWAQRLDIAPAAVPGLDEASDGEEEWAEGWAAAAPADEDPAFLQLPLDARHDLVMVQHEDELFQALSSAKGAGKVGFDMEWTSAYRSNETNVSILQLALPNWVFLIDVPAVNRSMETDDAWLALRQLLEDASVCKLFFSAYQDLLMLWQSVPALANADSYRGVVDLEPVAAACAASHERFFPFASEICSLSGLVHACLGKPLNKSQQMSNWQRRPLSAAQKVYAALDAHCLISIHDWMEKRRRELGLTALDLRPAANLKPPEKKKKKKKKTKPPVVPSSSSSSSDSQTQGNRPSSVVLSCHPRLQAAAEVLATVGCDVAVGSPLPGRLWVSSGEDAVVRVAEAADSEEQATSVLRALHIQVTPEDVVGACPECGARDFAQLSPDAAAVLAGDLTAAVSAREQKRLQKRGVDVESRSVGERPVRRPEQWPTDADLFLLCRACAELVWETPEQRRLRASLNA